MSKIKELYTNIVYDLVNEHNAMVQGGTLKGVSPIYENISNIPPANVGSFDTYKPYHIIENRHVNSFNEFELYEWFELNNAPLIETVITKHY